MTKSILRKDSGMSLAEVLMGLAVSAIALLIISSLLTDEIIRSAHVQSAMSSRVTNWTLEHAVHGRERTLLTGLTYLNPETLDALNIPWLTLGAGAYASLHSVPRSLVGTSSAVKSEKNGVSADISNIYQILIMLSRDGSAELLTVSDAAGSPAPFIDENATSGTIWVDGSTGSYQSGDNICILSESGNMIVQVTSVSGKQISFKNLGSYPIGPFTRNFPVTILSPGTQVVKVKVSLLGYAIDAKSAVLVDLANDGSFANIERSFGELDSFKLDSRSEALTVTKPFIPFRATQQIGGSQKAKSFTGNQTQYLWQIVL